MRLIDADTLKSSHIVVGTTTNSLCHLYVSLEDINSAPTIDAEPVKRGRWIENEKESEKHIEKIYICSNCHGFEAWGEYEKSNYCPNCGARMESGNE